MQIATAASVCPSGFPFGHLVVSSRRWAGRRQVRCGAVRLGAVVVPAQSGRACHGTPGRQEGRQDRTPGRFSPARDRNRNNNWGRESDKNPSPVPVRRRHWALLLTARCPLFTATGHWTIHSIAHYPWPITRCCMSVHTYLQQILPLQPACVLVSRHHTTPYHPIPHHTTHIHSCLPARAKIELYTCPPTGPVSPAADALAPSPRRRNFAAQHQT